MSKMRSAALSAVRKNLPAYTEPRWPTAGKPSTTLELLSGAEFVSGSMIEDVKAYVTPLLAKTSPHKLPRPLTAALKLALAKPSLSRIRDVESQCAVIIEAVHAGKRPVLGETFTVVEDLHDRCAVWAAALSCPVAAQRCAVLCLGYWRGRPNNGFVDVITYGLMRSMLDYLAVGDLEPAPDEIDRYIPESRHVQLAICEDLGRGMAHVLGVVSEAIMLGEPREEASGSGGGPLADLSDLADIREDRAGIVRQPRVKSAPRVDSPADPDDGGQTYGSPGWLPPGVPSMRVVGDLSHIKKGGKGEHDPVKDAEGIVGRRLPLVVPPADLAVTRAELLAEFPQLASVTDRLLRPLALQETIRLPHLLLWGPPGAGKTRYARRLAEVLDLQPAVYPMGGSTDSMTLAGVARGWSTGGFCAPVRDLIRTKIANPVLVIDESDKIGTSRHNGNALDVLVNMLGVETSARYRDPYLQADVDLSRVQWILTANSLDTIPRPLLDRCLVLRVDEPGKEHLRTLASSILAEVRDDRGLDDVWVPAFDGIEWAALEDHWKGGSLRGLRRLVEAVLDARDAGPRQ